VFSSAMHCVFQGDRFKDDEIGRACSTRRRVTNGNKVWLEKRKGSDNSEDKGVDGKIIL